MLMLRVVRLRRRAPRCASSAWTVRETLAAGRRNASAALEKLPLSTTRTKTFIARKRSMTVGPYSGPQMSGIWLFCRPKTGYYDDFGEFRLGGRGRGGARGGWGRLRVLVGRGQCRVARFRGWRSESVPG